MSSYWQTIEVKLSLDMELDELKTDPFFKKDVSSAKTECQNTAPDMTSAKSAPLENTSSIPQRKSTAEDQEGKVQKPYPGNAIMLTVMVFLAVSVLLFTTRARHNVDSELDKYTDESFLEDVTLDTDIEDDDMSFDIKYKSSGSTYLQLERSFGGTDDHNSLHNPINIAASDDGKMIAITDWNRNRVNVYDIYGAIQLKLDTRLDLGYRTPSYPVGVAITASGHFYVTDFNPWVNVYTPEGEHLFQFPSHKPRKANYYSKSGLRTLGVAVDTKGRVIVGEYWNNLISIHKPKGELLKHFNVGLEPRFISTWKNRILLGCYHCRKPVQVVSYSGKLIFNINNPFKDKTWSTTGVSFTEHGDILIASQSSLGNTGIYLFNTTGGFVDCVTQDVKDPRGITTVGDKVLVIDNTEVRVLRWR